MPYRERTTRLSESVANDLDSKRNLERNSEYAFFADRDLWREFKNGKNAAFIFIYNKYFSRLYIYGHQFTMDSDLIKDCIQDVFIVINLSKSRLSDTDSIQLYLYKSLRTKILKELKTIQKQKIKNSENSFRSFHFDLSIEQKIIDRQISEERKQKLNQAVEQLTEREREVIYYYYYENFTLDEIKQIMGFKSLKAGQNLIYKAIKGLREILLILPFIVLF